MIHRNKYLPSKFSRTKLKISLKFLLQNKVQLYKILVKNDVFPQFNLMKIYRNNFIMLAFITLNQKHKFILS